MKIWLRVNAAFGLIILLPLCGNQMTVAASKPAARQEKQSGAQKKSWLKRHWKKLAVSAVVIGVAGVGASVLYRVMRAKNNAGIPEQPSDGPRFENAQESFFRNNAFELPGNLRGECALFHAFRRNGGGAQQQPCGVRGTARIRVLREQMPLLRMVDAFGQLQPRLIDAVRQLMTDQGMAPGWINGDIHLGYEFGNNELRVAGFVGDADYMQYVRDANRSA